MARLVLPPIPYDAWRPTKETLHRYVQMLGKVRLAIAPPRNHWWHVSLRPTACGLTTGFIADRDGGFEIELDFLAHGADIRTSDGRGTRIGFRDGFSVAAFYRELFGRLSAFGIDAPIRAHPYDLSSNEPFPTDEVHASYDPSAVTDFGVVLRWVAGILEEFAGRFKGKSSPVHFFWHAFDLAHTRFSGRRAAPRPDATPVEAEAYTHECASFGFWPGDDEMREAAFYAYAAPAPPGIARHSIEPRTAQWNPDEAGQAVLRYADVRASADPRQAVMSFYESVFGAASARARWAAAEPTEVAS